MDNVLRAVEFYLFEYEKHTPQPLSRGERGVLIITIVELQKFLKPYYCYVSSVESELVYNFIEIENVLFL